MSQIAMTPCAAKPSGRHEQMGTRAMFLAAGLAMSAWAPLVPFAKNRLGVDEGALGLLLLCLGLGSLLAMPATGPMTSRFGCRRVMTIACIVLMLILPFLALADTVVMLALTLIVFGAAVGTLDVAINIQAIMVEKDAGRHMMSGFHGLFSLGSIFGAGGVALLLGVGIPAPLATLAVSGAIAILLIAGHGGLLPYGNRDGASAKFALPRGIVIVIGALTFISFLAEAAILDWGALFLIGVHGVAETNAGHAYAIFAVAMTVGRLSGDWIVRHLGPVRVVIVSGLLAGAGFLLAVAAPAPTLAFAGLLMIGFGQANIVPVLFTAAGRQSVMPPGLAVASVTTIGYAGILIGPALIGAVAHWQGISPAFLMLALALALVGLAGPSVLRRVG